MEAAKELSRVRSHLRAQMEATVEMCAARDAARQALADEQEAHGKTLTNLGATGGLLAIARRQLLESNAEVQRLCRRLAAHGEDGGCGGDCSEPDDLITAAAEAHAKVCR